MPLMTGGAQPTAQPTALCGAARWVSQFLQPQPNVGEAMQDMHGGCCLWWMEVRILMNLLMPEVEYYTRQHIYTCRCTCTCIHLYVYSISSSCLFHNSFTVTTYHLSNYLFIFTWSTGNLDQNCMNDEVFRTESLHWLMAIRLAQLEWPK